MASLILACPSCGKKRECAGSEVGEKVRCSCGMIFSVSPVFAPMTPAWVTHVQRMICSWPALIAAAVVLAGVGGLAAWLVHQPPPPRIDDSYRAAHLPKPQSDAIESPPTPETPTTPTHTPAPAVDSPALPPKLELPPSLKVRPDRLFDAFENAHSGRAKYGEKLIELSGPAKLSRDADGRSFLGFTVVAPRNLSPEQLAKLKPREREWETNGYPPNIRVYLDPARASAFEVLQLDGAVTIRGKVRERRDDPDVYMGYVVVVDAEDVGR